MKPTEKILKIFQRYSPEKKQVLFFIFSNVRRWGFGAERFTLEGGSKAGSGAGLFIFKNCAGTNIREALNEKLQHYRPSGEYDYIPLQTVPHVSPTVTQNQMTSPAKAANGVSRPPFASSGPPLPAAKPKPKVPEKHFGLNLNGSNPEVDDVKSNGCVTIIYK